MNEPDFKLLKYIRQHRQDFEREAQRQRQVSGLNPTLQTRVALWLNRLAVRLEPELATERRQSRVRC